MQAHSYPAVLSQCGIQKVMMLFLFLSYTGMRQLQEPCAGIALLPRSKVRYPSDSKRLAAATGVLSIWVVKLEPAPNESITAARKEHQFAKLMMQITVNVACCTKSLLKDWVYV